MQAYLFPISTSSARYSITDGGRRGEKGRGAEGTGAEMVARQVISNATCYLKFGQLVGVLFLEVGWSLVFRL